MNRRLRLGSVLALLATSWACGGGAPEPADLDTRNEQCAGCRMAVSNPRFAAQVVAAGELPLFFDDLGCLAGFLKAGRAPAGATVFVADHLTKAWVRAERAVYTRVSGLETPMSSHLVAHGDPTSRDQDRDARGGSPVPAAEVLGPAWAPQGGSR